METTKLAILLSCFAIGAEAVRAAVTFSGDTAAFTRSDGVLKTWPVAANCVAVRYIPGGTQVRLSPTVDPHMARWGSFSTIDTVSNPVSLGAPGFRLAVNRNGQQVSFYGSSGAQLFQSSDISRGDVSGQGPQGPYYGINNRPSGSGITALTGSEWYYESAKAGGQGAGGGPFVWTTAGFGILGDGADWVRVTPECVVTVNRWKLNETYPAHTVYLIAGTPHEIMAAMYQVTGRPPMPPMWALGFIHSEWGHDQAELYGTARDYRSRSIPLDCQVLDFEWMDWGQDNYGEFRWNTTLFPDAMSGAVKDTMDSYHVKMMGIRKPRIHVNTAQGAYCAAQNGWVIGAETDYWSHQSVHLVNMHLAGEWFWQRFIDPAWNSYERGIVGCWNDEFDYQEPPETGYTNFFYVQKAQYEGQRAYNNNRVFSINRNFQLGAHRYAYAMWSGDIGGEWSTLQDQPAEMLRSINIGCAWWTDDIGGFNINISQPDSMFARWMQAGAFFPIYRTHGTGEREVWKHGPLSERISRSFIQLRYSLLPHIYTAFRELSDRGLPPVRPLPMDYPQETGAANEARCWKFGKGLLVAPVTTRGATSVSYYLPQGSWYDFWTDSLWAGGREVTYACGTDRIAVMAAAGSVILRQPVGQWTADPAATREIEFHAYAGADGDAVYYEDDFDTYACESGAVLSVPVQHQWTSGQSTVTIGAGTRNFATRRQRGRWIFHGIAYDPQSVHVRGAAAVRLTSAAALDTASSAAWYRDAAARTVTVVSPDPLSAGTVVVAAGQVSTARLAAAPEMVQDLPGQFRVRAAAAGVSVELTILALNGRVIHRTTQRLAPYASGVFSLPRNARAKVLYTLKIDAVIVRTGAWLAGLRQTPGLQGDLR